MPSFIFGELPEEVKQEALRHQASADEYRHTVARMFDEMPEDHLKAILGIMHNLTNLPSRQAMGLASFYEGIAAGKLHQRFNICIGCGLDHDKALNDMGGGGEAKEHADSDPPKDPTEPTELPPEDLSNMEKFGLDDVRDEDTLKLLYFVCLGCGMHYQSIEDRMKEPPGPEGCSGCRQKAKWG